MSSIVKAFGIWWLSGAKYAVSKTLAGKTWDVLIEEALHTYGKTLKRCRNLDDLAKVFSPRWRWLPDPFFQAWDRVYPPALLLGRDGDDCDGWAMTHAQAIQEVMGKHGWQAYILSYLAEDFRLSHHFAVGVDPSGLVWAVQPQPGREQPDDSDPVIHMPFVSFEEAVRVIASCYGTSVVWWDVRMPDFSPKK